jgi:hypothetical protein
MEKTGSTPFSGSVAKGITPCPPVQLVHKAHTFIVVIYYCWLYGSPCSSEKLPSAEGLFIFVSIY